MADIEVARTCDLGVNDDRLTVRSHLGHILKPGHFVMGYDMRTVNLSGEDTSFVTNNPSKYLRADVYLVRRSYGKADRKLQRNWTLQELPKTNPEGMELVPTVKVQAEMEDFKADLEEDVEMRREVNLYRERRSKKKKKTGGMEGVVEAKETKEPKETAVEADINQPPQVPLEELLEGLTLDDSEEDE
eukprot:Platyproteum_vivax@DN7370_c0_g3_i1.p1